MEKTHRWRAFLARQPAVACFATSGCLPVSAAYLLPENKNGRDWKVNRASLGGSKSSSAIRQPAAYCSARGARLQCSGDVRKKKISVAFDLPDLGILVPRFLRIRLLRRWQNHHTQTNLHPPDL